MEIQSDVKPPTFFEEPTETAKKGRKKAEPKPVDQVLENLKFLGQVVKKSGTVQETHIQLADGFATACIGELTIGCPLAFNVNGIVNHHDLIEAKKVAGMEFAATSSGDQLVIVANDVRMVLGVDWSQVWASPRPDSPIAPANDQLRVALSAVAPFATDDRAHIKGVLCQAFTAVATNGYAILEYWHGVDMPPNLRLPVSFIKKLEKIKRPITQFGFSECSFTVWFEDGAYLRTAMYSGQFHQYGQVFTDSQEFELVDLPEEFYKTLKSLKSFAKDGVVYFKDGQIYTGKQAESASSFKHEAIPNGFGFNINYLLLVAPHASTVKFMNSCDKIQFECGNSRGIVMGIDMRPPQKIADPVRDEQYNDNWEDDVPF